MTPHRAHCRRAPFGWWCSRECCHDGPCAARPRWWNLLVRIHFRGRW